MLSALVVLLLGSPEADAAKLLEVAYASQYEWKEDDVKSVTLEFAYTWEWTSKDGTGAKIEGTGQVVVVGDEVVRRHYPDFSDSVFSRRGRFNNNIEWVVGRFMRKPFKLLFDEKAKFSAPEKTALGTKVIANGRAYYLVNDRIARKDKEVGTAKRPQQVLVEYEHGEVGGGYAIVKEKCSYTRKSDRTPVSWTRTLTTADSKKAPVPASYTHTRKDRGRTDTISIQFDQVSMDTENPILLEPKTRDLLKAAWERRYTLPADVRIEGDWARRIDKDLDKARWPGRARGHFQVWGMDKIEALFEDKLFSPRMQGWADDVLKTCKSHILWIFRTMDGKPFDEEFKNCGFELVPQGKDQVIQVYGYPHALAFKLSGEAVVAHYEMVGGRKGWSEYKLKRTSDSRFLIERMTRVIDKRKYSLEFRYSRTKGLHIPKKMDVLGVSWQGILTPGTAEYSFRKLKVSVPKSG